MNINAETLFYVIVVVKLSFKRLGGLGGWAVDA
jgi:hypothetical protein